MSPALPQPLRAAAGLAALTLTEARRLPNRLVSLPVVAVGAAMQLSMRAQQEYAGLVARGDEVLTGWRGQRHEAPDWARFDDDPGAAAREPGPPGIAPSSFDLMADSDAVSALPTDAVLGAGGAVKPVLGPTDAVDVAPVAGYDVWTVAQLRARLRQLSTDQLTELLGYERASRQRAAYLTMLENRLARPRRG
ncbi:lipid droplet-associated protein [soil metagenome]